MLPFALFLAVGGVIALVARLAQAVSGDPPQSSGWVTTAIAFVAVVGVSLASQRLHGRQWRADEETSARAPFVTAQTKAQRAHTIGAVSAALTLGAELVPFIAWSTGAIDAHRTALLTSLAAGAIIAAGFVIWEASNPPLPDD